MSLRPSNDAREEKGEGTKGAGRGSGSRRRLRPRRRRRVCLFGTSANPPTGDGGHRGVARHLAEARLLDDDGDGDGDGGGGEGDALLFDEVRILPVYRHMYASKRGNQASFDDRMDMCRLAFDGLPNVTVSDAERTLFERAAEGLNDDDRASLRVGTADLLDALVADEPDADFALALGTDTFLDLTAGKWRRSRDVLSSVGGRIVVIRRLSDDAIPAAELEGRVRAVNEEFGRASAATSASASAAAAAKNESEGGPDGSPPGEDETARGGPARVVRIASLSDVSSSFVRSCTDEDVLRGLLVPGVLEYIRERRMYGFAAEGDDG